MVCKIWSAALLVVFTINGIAQEIDYNLNKGFGAKGYDVVQYFKSDPEKGKDDFVITQDGVKYKFINQANLEQFKKEPKKYLPEYGGWCAYAMGLNGKKYDIDPETYEIRDGKLYLFYNKFTMNTLESWLEEDPVKLRDEGDKNWKQVKYLK